MTTAIDVTNVSRINADALRRRRAQEPESIDNTRKVPHGPQKPHAQLSCATLGCAPLRPASRICHCTSCHRTFTAVTSFEKHRRDSACIDPVTVGLELKASGRWGRPGAEQADTQRYAVS